MPLRLAFLALVLAAASVQAAPNIPLLVSWQGRLLKGDDQPVQGSVALTFRIHAAAAPPASGSPPPPIWEGTFQLTAKDGLVGALLGETKDGAPALPAEAFDGTESWLGVSVDGAAELSPRLRLATVPFALVTRRAITADDAASLGGKPASAWLLAADADARFLTKEAGDAAYLAKDATEAFLTAEGAANTFLAKTDAALAYLTKAEAAETYVTGAGTAFARIDPTSPQAGGLSLTGAVQAGSITSTGALEAGSIKVGGTTIDAAGLAALVSGASGTYTTGKIALAAGAGTDVDHNLGSNDLSVTLWASDDDGATWELTPPTPSVSTGVFGSGVDGPLSVSQADQRIDSVRAPVIGNAGESTATILSGGAGTFAAGMRVLLLQMRGAAGSAGRYEEASIVSVNGSTLTFASPLQFSYVSGGANAAQVLRVPQYTTVTVQDGAALRPSPWDGATGGVLAFKASVSVSLGNTGRLDASGRGFRGGLAGRGPSDTTSSGGPAPQAGESWIGPPISGSNQANGGGGGGGVAGNAEGMTGGHGGSYGSAGGGGTSACSSCPAPNAAGAPYGTADLTTLFAGSGGGGGSNAYQCNASPSGIDQPAPKGNGGAGGGIVYVVALTFLQNGGQVVADGVNGNDGHVQGTGSCPINGGGGGGGSGGSILLTSANASGAFFARGGAGGTAPGTSYNGWSIAPNGGAGGVGRIRVNGALAGSTTGSPTALTTAAAASSPTGFSLSVKQVNPNRLRVTNASPRSVNARVVVRR